MVKLSLLIPYYNTYEYTKKLLEELSIQINEEIEVIIVDDGCKEKRLDDIINNNEDLWRGCKLIHNRKNEGASNSLNKALEYATGEYIGFIDSDDMITMDYIDVLLDTLKTHNEDIIYFNWADFNNNQIIRYPGNYALWKAIYKREIFPGFEKDRRVHNDVPVQEILRKTKHSEYYIDRVLYIYNSNRVGSITWNLERREKND